MDKEKEIILGIDLGTTNSEVALVVDGKPVLIKIDGATMMPSVVSFASEETVFVGTPAVNNELTDPSHTIRWIKRKMGKQELLSLQGKDYTPAMISSLILTKLKLAAEAFAGKKIVKAVITVPAFFTEQQRMATKEAGEMAGLEVVRLLNEPTAAALAYSLGKKEKELSLVYDLGGGTFDVSIVDLSEGIMEVLASEGDTFLGGCDFDLLIAAKIREQFQKEHHIDLSTHPLSWIRILRAAEEAKIRLSQEASTEIMEEFITEKKGVPLHVKMTLFRSEFEEMIRPVLEKTLLSVRKAMQNASITSEQLDRVILVGGSTYIPLVSQILEQELQISPQSWIDPITIVAQGAAIEAASLSGEQLGTRLFDITPHSLGIASLDAADSLTNTILIRKNTPIPCTVSRTFYKVFSHQEVVRIAVYQGESQNLQHVTKIGEFMLEGLGESDRSGICVKFHLDANGLLHVSAADEGCGISASHVITRESIKKVEVDASHLKSLHIAPSEKNVSLDVVSEETPVEQSETTSLLEAVIAKALKVLDNPALQEETRQELVASLQVARELGNTQKLEELLYYLD